MMKCPYIWGEYSKDSISEETKNYFIKKLEEQSVPEYHCDDYMAGETETSYFSRTPLIINPDIDPYYRSYFNIPGYENIPEKVHLEIHANFSVPAYNPKDKTENFHVSGFTVRTLNINGLYFIKNIRYVFLCVDTCAYTGFIFCPFP